MAVIDLTRTLCPGMPVYPGDPSVRFERRADYAPDGFRVTELRLGTHAGTHVDAPAHFLPEGETIDRLSLDVLIGPARVVSMAGERHGFLRGERIILRSGWAERWGGGDYFSAFPGLGRAIAEQLAAAPVALLGLETPSLHPDPEEDAHLHRLLLGQGIVIVENLVNVHLLPERCYLAALPLPLGGLDGAPARVAAITLEDNFHMSPQGDQPLIGEAP
ncbi:MAG: cyclase family protein [Actinomycetota bacterium]